MPPSERPIVIPISAGSLLGHDPLPPAQGGDTRMVPMVPVGEGKLLPCIWKSHAIKNGIDHGGQSIRVHECLLLASRDPLLTLRAEVAVESWQHFGHGPVEW
jgi:hypothetical protein